MTASTMDLTQVLDDLAMRVPQIEQVVVLTRDGLAVGSSPRPAAEDAERLAAIAAGFHSLARGAAGELGAGHVQQIVVELTEKLLLVTVAGEHGCLAVVTSGHTDMGIVAFEMALVAGRVSRFLPGARKAAASG